MQSHLIKGCFLILFTATLLMDAEAQRTPRRRTDANRGQQQPAQQPPPPPAANPGPTYAQPSTGGTNPYGNIPLVVDSTGVSDSVVRKSMRKDAAYDTIFAANNERIPLGYDPIRWDDALFAEKVWRELDMREKMNQPFRYEGTDDRGSQMFVDILLAAVNRGEVTAFSDDRFTTPMSLAEVGQLTAGSADTVDQTDPLDPTKVVARVVTRSSFDAKSVNRLRIKEEWIFDRETSRMVVRILGIAPLQTKYLPNGQERGSSVMFWVYYPDLRPILTKYEVYNPKNLGNGRMTWEELFESRMFSSYITKSTMDNPQNKIIRGVIKDPILALLEGENIKERIFNYEQDLWSY